VARLGTAARVSSKRLCCPLLNFFRLPLVKPIFLYLLICLQCFEGYELACKQASPQVGPRSFTFFFPPEYWYKCLPSRLQIQRPLFVLISKCGMARVREELKALDSVIITFTTACYNNTETHALSGASSHQHGFAGRSSLACTWF
jgi:hypothetical protein